MLFHRALSLYRQSPADVANKLQLMTCHYQRGQDSQNNKEKTGNCVRKAEGTTEYGEKGSSATDEEGRGKKASWWWKQKAAKGQPNGDNLEHSLHPAQCKLRSHTEGRLEERPQKTFLVLAPWSLGLKAQRNHSVPKSGDFNIGTCLSLCPCALDKGSYRHPYRRMVHTPNSLLLSWSKTYRVSDSSEPVEHGKDCIETDVKGCPLPITSSPSRSWTYREMTNPQSLFYIEKSNTGQMYQLNQVKWSSHTSLFILMVSRCIQQMCKLDRK